MTDPSSITAHEWESPAAMLLAFVMVVTTTGVKLCVLVPSPSCPLPFEPQHLTSPSIRRAQEWEAPRASFESFVPVAPTTKRATNRTLSKARQGIFVQIFPPCTPAASLVSSLEDVMLRKFPPVLRSIQVVCFSTGTLCEIRAKSRTPDTLRRSVLEQTRAHTNKFGQ